MPVQGWAASNVWNEAQLGVEVNKALSSHIEARLRGIIDSVGRGESVQSVAILGQEPYPGRA